MEMSGPVSTSQCGQLETFGSDAKISRKQSPAGHEALPGSVVWLSFHLSTRVSRDGPAGVHWHIRFQLARGPAHHPRAAGGEGSPDRCAPGDCDVARLAGLAGRAEGTWLRRGPEPRYRGPRWRTGERSSPSTSS